MNARELRGLKLAEQVNIQPVSKGVGKWIVPSTSSNAKYTVDLNSNSKRCNCPDYELRRCKCKHIYAVEYSIRKSTVTETNACGNTVITETVKVTKRTTYQQNWPAYNAAQTTEKAHFQVLLHGLCKDLPEPERTIGKYRGGRAPIAYSDSIFSATFKVYSTVSGRRFISDLKEAHGKGYVSRCIHFNSIFNCLDAPEVTSLLDYLIKRSSLPLKNIEEDFAVDSSGFSGSKFGRWYYEKYNPDRQSFIEERERADWVKMHLMCGVKTNVVTSVEISGRYEHDSPFLPELVKQTAQNFTLKEVSADKAYSSIINLHAIRGQGAIPYIPFKSNATGEGKTKGCKVGEGDDLWLTMWRYYTFHTDEFMQHYHKRSNNETTFSMIKAKFGDALRSKNETAKVNEAFCKVLCHNICCVIQSIHELGIEAEFDTRFCAEPILAHNLPTN